MLIVKCDKVRWKKQYLYRSVQKEGHFLSDKCIDTMAPKPKKDQHDQA